MNIVRRLTLRHMMMNKKRTLVTMIGIIISVAMITAVSTVGYSIMDFMARMAMVDNGFFHVKFGNYFYKDNEKIVDEFDVENYSLMKAVGDYVYEFDDEGNLVTTPYVYDEDKYENGYSGFTQAFRLLAVQDNYYETASIRLSEGDYPKNDKEVLLSCVIGDACKDKKTGDKIIIGNTEYTISGIIENYEFESGDLRLPDAVTYPVYTKLDVNDLKEDDIVSGYFYAGGVIEDIEERADDMVSELQSSGVPQDKLLGENATWFCSGTDVSYNEQVLYYFGISRYDNANIMMNTLKLILIVIIMIGSISLIANGFIISISERSRYLGMLASIGATKKQKRGSVYFEGFIEGIIAIPLGMLAGFGGIAITFKLIEPMINELSGTGLGLNLIVNGQVIIWAVVFSVLTIFLSAYIPAGRASRITPIDAIRQNKDVKITSKAVKTMGITKKIFGFEGDLALKNLKRNKKRYRVTVFSMFISLTLFLSVYSLVHFVRTSYETELGMIGYNISFSYMADREREEEKTPALNEEFKTITDKLLATDYIEKAQRYSPVEFNECHGEVMTTEDKYYDDRYLQYLERTGIKYKDTFICIIVMENEDLKAYLESVDVDYEDFVSDENNVLLFDEVRLTTYMGDDRYAYEGNIYSDLLKELDYQIKTAWQPGGTLGVQGEIIESEIMNLKLNVYRVDDKLLGTEWNESPWVLITPQLAEKLQEQGLLVRYMDLMFVKTDNADSLEELFNEELVGIEDGNRRFDVYNYTEEVEYIEKSILLMSVFAYGFIILMSLICAANIVNTISTSLSLRKREFAMLKSVGMTDKAFRKMIAYESGFYGIKALIFGLPVGTAIMFLIRNTIEEPMGVELGIPWMGYIIAIAGVFIVIGTTMLYSARKIRKENVIDALKNENV